MLFVGFNFMAHGTQDLYSTLLTKQFSVPLNKKTLIIVISNIASFFGGITGGSASEVFGRRLTIIICLLLNGAFLYPAFHNADKNWWAYVLIIFSGSGAWGSAAIHLLELVNSTHRTLLAGLAYQLENLISSASMTIEEKIRESFQIEGAAPGVFDYGLVMCIFSGAVLTYMFICVFLGPERFHKEIRVLEDVHELEDDEERAVDMREKKPNV